MEEERVPGEAMEAMPTKARVDLPAVAKRKGGDTLSHQIRRAKRIGRCSSVQKTRSVS